jgi:hypothetical protein
MTLKKDVGHTGKELELMLAGKKPFAAFGKFAGETFDATGGQPFEEHVLSGRLEKHRFYRKIPVADDLKTYVTTVYCLHGESWRVPIYKATMLNLASRWNNELEIIEGILLGYNLDEMVTHFAGLRPAGNNDD